MYRYLIGDTYYLVADTGSSLKTGPAGARKNRPRYHCSWVWSIFSLQYQYNDNIW